MKKLFSVFLLGFLSFLTFHGLAFATDFNVTYYQANPPGDLQVTYSDIGHSDCTNFEVHRASDNVQVYGFGTSDWSGVNCTSTGISFTNAPIGDNNLSDGDYYLVLSNADGAHTWSVVSQTFHLASNSFGSSPTPTPTATPDFTVTYYHATSPGDLQINYSDIGHNDCTNFEVRSASNNLERYGFGTSDWSGVNCTSTGISFTNAPIGDNGIPDDDYYLVLSNADGAHTWSVTSQTFHLTSSLYRPSITPTPFTVNSYQANPPGDLQVTYSDIGHSDCASFEVHRASDNVQVYGFRTAGWSGLSCTSTSISFTNAPLGDNDLPDGDYYLVLSNDPSGIAPYTWSEISQTFHLTSNLYPTPNHAPVISSLANDTINEGDTYSATGSFTDPDSTSWTGAVDYGDSSGSHSLTLSGMNFSLSHVYKDNGTYTVTVSVTDNQGATGTSTAQVTVNNVAPTPGAITISPNPVQINTSVSATANFTDPGVLDTHTATINWGDGVNTNQPCSVTEPSGSTPGTVTCALSSGYASANVYPVSITVSDGTASGTSPTAYASVYNPTQQGIFSAGQRFSNPATAYPSTSGNVTFGLSYKYQGSMPTGVRQFSMDFNAANLHFNATNISALVIANNMATLTGTGMLNGGSQTYNFLVTGVNGGDIRIQITDSSNNVIYDTQPGAAATATPTTSVTGNIVVHN